MRGRILTVVGLALTLSITASQGQWTLRVHEGDDVTEFTLSNIDSLSFYEAATPEPGMIEVLAGDFIMGDGVATCGVDEREVTLTRSFYLGEHEVTNQEYLVALQWAYDNSHVWVDQDNEFVWDDLDGSTQVVLLDMESPYGEIWFDGQSFDLRETDYANQHAYPEGYNEEDHPVKEVTWYGAVRYCDWLSMQAGLPRAYQHSGDWACNGADPYGAEGYRLPTDAEWEYAAQFDDERIYPWGDEYPHCELANFNDYYGTGDYCVRWTTLVGIYPDGLGFLGFSDMAGNVWEWCNDWEVCDLGTNPVTDPTGPAIGTDRVLHGGSWLTFDNRLRCACRNGNTPDHSHQAIGFRVARTVIAP